MERRWTQANAGRTRMVQEWYALCEQTDEAAWWARKSGPEHYSEHIGRLREWVDELIGRRSAATELDPPDPEASAAHAIPMRCRTGAAQSSPGSARSRRRTKVPTESRRASGYAREATGPFAGSTWPG
jgi:hypothetical protein